VQIKVAENGEILVKSAGLLKEYYKNPTATAEVLSADGWYHTSDAGFIDASGHLKIIDRVKDVGRIKGGANDGAMFAPKYVENKLKFFPHIKEVVAYGDGREKVCVMINIDFDAVGNWAERRNLPYAGYTDLAQKPEVYQLIKECVEKVNADLSVDTLLAGSQSAASWCCTRSWTPTTANSHVPTRFAAASSPRNTCRWSMRCTAARPNSSLKPS
jgi:long-chain acyl-CoA synthetase